MNSPQYLDTFSGILVIPYLSFVVEIITKKNVKN